MQKRSREAVTRISSPRCVWRFGLAAAVLFLAGPAPASEPLQPGFSYDALNSRMPVVRQQSYVVNAKVRPMLLFWIERDNVGDARLTWRKAAGDRRGFELLIGSDPARTPRRINRWGFIVEELNPGNAEILGLMKESSEETIEAAEAEISRPRDVSVFKAAQTTIAGGRAVTKAMTVQAPAHLTYHELDSFLALIPTESRSVRTVELPSGTQYGFLVAMDSLMRTSAVPCGSPNGAGAQAVHAVPFVYGHTLYDLTLVGCTFERTVRTASETVTDIAEGRFQVRNRTTGNATKFRVFYGTSGSLLGVPVKAVFRPRWWMEIELLLDRSTSHAVVTTLNR